MILLKSLLCPEIYFLVVLHFYLDSNEFPWNPHFELFQAFHILWIVFLWSYSISFFSVCASGRMLKFYETSTVRTIFHSGIIQMAY